MITISQDIVLYLNNQSYILYQSKVTTWDYLQLH